MLRSFSNKIKMLKGQGHEFGLDLILDNWAHG